MEAEEVDPATGEFRGNFPQAFSHVGLVNSVIYLNDARGVDLSPEPMGVRLGYGDVVEERSTALPAAASRSSQGARALPSSFTGRPFPLAFRLR